MAANQPSHTPKPERNAPFFGEFGISRMVGSSTSESWQIRSGTT